MPACFNSSAGWIEIRQAGGTASSPSSSSPLGPPGLLGPPGPSEGLGVHPSAMLKVSLIY
jgi:hypothetical protein